MLRLKRSPFVFIIFLCFSGSIYAQAPWSGVLDPSRAIDWSKAGATISTSRTQCTTSQCNAVSNGTSVTAASINAALASAPANTYVLIPAGTFAMSTGITFSNRSNVTLRGSGSNSTFLVWTSSAGGPGNCGGHDVCASSSDTNYWGGPSYTANWMGTNGVAGTYTKGATSIILSAAPPVGNPIILDQIDDHSDNGGLYVGCEIADGSPACYSGAAPNGYERGTGSLSTIRGQQQIVNVTSISGTGPYSVGITPGIYAANWQSSHSPGAWWASNPVRGDAVENISLDHTNGGDGITFFNCTGCWVKGIRSVRASATGTGYAHVYFSICNHCTVRDSYIFGYHGDSYGLSTLTASDILVENNITELGSVFQFYNSDCEGCVASYNFSPGVVFDNSANWLAQPADFHGIDLFSLSEGNIGAGLYADSFHGTHDLNTQFRNRWDGREQNNGAPTTSSTVALRLNPGARYDNAIGNVFGTSGYHQTYKSAYNAGGTPLNFSVIDCGAYPETNTYDSLVCPTSMFWGNWDSVNKAAVWNTSEVPSGLSAYSNPVPSSHSLPASFIYSSAPSWWPSGKAWPPIGPDVTGGNVGQCQGGVFDSSEAASSSQCSGGSFTPKKEKK